MAYQSSDWECLDQSATREVCVTPGADVAIEYRSAWWQEIDGEIWVLTSGHACVELVEHVPTGWNECTGADEEPAACRCLCHQGVCTGDEDAAMLANCDAPMVCPPASAWLKFGITPELQCVFEGLRDRVPGIYAVNFPGPNDSTEWQLLVAADGSVQATRRVWWLTGCPTALNGVWRPTAQCQLAGSDLFAECAAAGDNIYQLPACDAEQFALDGWIEGCTDAPLSCD